MNILNEWLQGEKLPEDLKNITTLPIFKGKGDTMKCGKYTVMRLLEHGTKVY